MFQKGTFRLLDHLVGGLDQPETYHDINVEFSPDIVRKSAMNAFPCLTSEQRSSGTLWSESSLIHFHPGRYWLLLN